MNDIDKEIRDLEAEITRLKAQKKNIESMSDVEVLACKLHELLCHHNHTDQCGWLYEISSDGEHKWHKWTHDKYLSMAKMVVGSALEINVATLVVDILIKSK